MTTKMANNVLITGGSGQDAAYLARLLLSKQHDVYLGVRRSASRQGMWRIEKLGIDQHPNLHIIDLDLLDYSNIKQVFDEIKPAYVYNLGAQSFVGVSYKQPLSTHLVNGMGVTYLLDIIKNFYPKTRMYQASTSEMFGNAPMPESGYDETSPMIPESPYGASKLYAHNMVKIYREAYGLFVCSGILFNHESPLRGDEFVTKKIINHVRDNIDETLLVGNIYAKRDWGHAADYVKAMHLMLTAKEPRDYVVATGESYTVKDFITLSYPFPLIWQGKGLQEHALDEKENIRVAVSEKFYRPTEVNDLKGNSSKIKTELGWQPAYNLPKLVREMLIS